MRNLQQGVLFSILVYVNDVDAFVRLKGERTGQLLIDALQGSPHREIELEPRRSAMPVRAVKL